MLSATHNLNLNSECPICQEFMQDSFATQVLNKYTATYQVCNGCGFLRAYEPHWLEESYSRAIATADTGLMMRNISLASKLSSILYLVMGERGNARYLDAAGGYGILTRLMRDFGFDFYWADKYCDNLVATGFEYSKDIGVCKVVTAIEVMEHLTDPVSFIKETFGFSGASSLIFTTELYEGEPPSPDSWWYYAFATGQHIGFFQRKTFEVIAKKLDLHFVSTNGIHVLSRNHINQRLLALATNRFVSLLAPIWIRRKLGSKTKSDYQLMLQNIS